MKTNFFEMLAALQLKADWKINITTEANGKLIVSVLLVSEKTDDNAKHIVPPMIFKGLPNELDEGFFDALIKPATETTTLFANMEQYVKQLEQAKQKSKMQEEQQKKIESSKEERQKKYDAQIKKVEELEEKEKWGEAIGAMPKADQFPDQADEIKLKLEDLRSKHGQLSLL